MKKDYILSVRCWSKRFVSLLPLSPHHLGTPAHLPRFMCADDQLPRFVQECPTTMAIIPKLRLLAWETADQPACRQWFGKEPIPSVAYIGAFLVKIDRGWLLSVTYAVFWYSIRLWCGLWAFLYMGRPLPDMVLTLK